jgi:stage II sporulation protein D
MINILGFKGRLTYVDAAKMNRLPILIILLFVLSAVGSAAAPRPETVRVALLKGAESVRVDGSGMLMSDGTVALDLETPLEVRRSRDAIFVNGRSLRRLIVSAAQRITVNGKGYRGVIEITPSDKGLLVVNELGLEEYLVGLINCEISSAWPIEAVKAQAVIARSYAMYQKGARKGAPYQLESSVMDQVYDGTDGEDSRAARGVQETAGEVLAYDGKVIQAFYHSNCAGHTEDAENVWGQSVPYLRGVPCDYCRVANPVHWDLTLALKKVEAALKAAGYQTAGLRDVKVAERNASGRVQSLSLLSARGWSSIPGVAFRKALGYGTVKSTNFEVRVEGDDCLISGSGSGHGVGLCQWGAKERAAGGFSYREILSYYYPGARLSKVAGF